MRVSVSVSASLAVLGAFLPTSAAATSALDCTGGRSAPRVTISLGDGDWVFRADIVDHGRSMIATPGATPRIRQRAVVKDVIDFDVLTAPRTILAIVRVAPRSGSAGYTGTMIIRGREYRLRCGEAG
jgi:hypothetical protein